MSERRPGGTSLQPPSSLVPLLAFLVVTPVVTYVVHRPQDWCGWSWSSVGGACRAILLISIISGLAAGGFAAVCARAFVAEERRRAAVFAALVVVATIAGLLGTKQFGDYARGVRRSIDHTMDR